MAQLKPYAHGYYLWDYVPTKIGAIVAVVLFSLGTLVIVYRAIRTRTKFSIPFIIGGCCRFRSPRPHAMSLLTLHHS